MKIKNNNKYYIQNMEIQNKIKMVKIYVGQVFQI